MARIGLEEIREILAKHDWQCLSTEYKNLDTLMTFKCNEGHEVTSTWKKIRSKMECPICKSNSNKQIANIKARPRVRGKYRILALDQSSRITGYSVYDNCTLIGYGFYETSKEKPIDRIVDICDWLNSMIDAWQPDAVGLEETQYNPGAGMGHDVFKLLSQVMGAAMITIAREKVEVKTVLIPTWRHHCKVKGNKRADQKRSAQHLVKQWYDITVTDDESDAICIGKYFSDTHNSNKVVIGEWVE